MRWLAILRVLKVRAFLWQHETLAALISLQVLQNLLHVLGYPAVTLFVMLESTGIPLPGETMLLLASFYAAIDHQMQLWLIIVCAAAGAIMGDNLGYLVGRTGGRAFVLRFGRYLFLKPQYLDRAEKFFAKHGDKTVFFGRFIAVLRAWAAFLAGVNHMRWRTFVVYNAAGGILWATIYGILGYVAGRLFHDNFNEVEHLARIIGWTGAGIIIAVVLAIIIVFRIRRARRSRSTSTSEKPEKLDKSDKAEGSATPETSQPSERTAATSAEKETATGASQQLDAQGHDDPPSQDFASK